MLAGLIFATHDAEDRPDTLTATLPFGGTTIVEAQARLLVELGASQIIIIVTRLTPELLGAIGRIGRRGVAVDPVRSAAEAAEKLHPLARVLVLADGLVSTPELVAPLAGEGIDALLVTEATDAPASFERIGGNAAWAGVMRLAPKRIAEAARLPRDYDLQSSLLHVASQANAAHMLLARRALGEGHGIEYRAASVAERGRAILAAGAAQRPAWFDRWLVAPLARRALPALVERHAPTIALAGMAALLGLLGVGAFGIGASAIGLALLLAAVFPLALGTTLSRLREERMLEIAEEAGIATLAAVGALLLARAVEQRTGSPLATAIAIALVVVALLAERAALPLLRRRWWASPPAYLLLLLAGAAAGWPLAGLVASVLYATVTLAAAIEGLRAEA